VSLPYTLDDVRAYFDSGAVKRGTDYYLKSKVLKVAQNPAMNNVYGTVSGSGHHKYNVSVRIDTDTSTPSFYAVCSCPVRIDCKHAVAILYTNWFQQMDLQAQEAGTQTQQVESSPGKSREIENWLEELETQLSSKTIDTKNDIAAGSLNRLLYVLTLQKQPYGDRLLVNYLSARPLKAGGYGKDSRYDPYRIVSYGRTSFISTDDEIILREVYARKMMDYIEYDNLSASRGGELLSMMLATGRCFWQDKNTPPLTPGEPAKGEMHWRTFDDASQQLNFVAEDAEAIILPTIPPFYINESKGICGPLEIDVPKKAMSLIQAAPRVSPSDLSVVTERLTNLVKNVPAPKKISTKNKTGIKPVPCLHFTLFDDGIDDPYDYIEPIPVMEITLDYDGKKTSLYEQGVALNYMQNNQLIKLKRNLPAEKKCLDLIESVPLIQLIVEYVDETLPQDLFTIPAPPYANEENVWVSFMIEDLPLFREQGWQISFDDEFPYRLAEIDEWHMDVDDSSDNNHWFDLNLGILVNGERYNLIHLISILIKQNPRIFKNMQTEDANPPENIMMRLNDGVILPIPYDRISRIVSVLLELYDKKGDVENSLKLPKWRASELNELQSQGLQWQGGDELKKTADKLAGFKGVKPKAAPKKFKAKLRDYQKDGLAWLQFLREYNFHGVLADDMGLGKTVQALAHICAEKAGKRLDKPVLVIAPTSLMYNWRHEAEQFAPHLSILTLHGPDRKKHFDSISDHDVVLTTYPLLGRDDEVLLAQDWHMLILDEAQNIKNPKAKATKIACRLKAKHRLCLTGTPMENHLGELWSVFNFLMPGLLGDEKQFRQLFRTPIEKQGDTERAKRLAKRLAPFMLRRKKDEVAKELPAKTEIVRSVGLDGVQRDLYETVRVSMQKKVRDSISQLGMGKSHIIVLDALLKLRQICCDPRLLKSNAKAKKSNSAKFDLLMSLLPELLEEGRKILLFSQFTSMLGLIEDELKVRKIKYVKLTGSTRNREKPITDFQSGDVPLFLISLKAGGTGLNLTAADTVIHYDPWWNPAVEAQATDRAHRIGQKNPVFVYKLLTDDTVEARIQVMQETKKKLADSLFDGTGKGKLPDAKSLEALFEPL